MSFWDRLDRLTDRVSNVIERALQLWLLLLIVLAGLIVVLVVWAMIAGAVSS